ncbi:MAG: lysostaphin resistance A-like protein [Actinomycetota bacterium]
MFAPGAAWRIAWPIAMVAIGIAALVVVAAAADAIGASNDSTTAIATFVGSGVILLGGLLLVRVLPPAQRRVTVTTKGRLWPGIGLGVAVGLGCVVGSGAIIAAGAELDEGAKQALEDLDLSVGVTWWQMTLMVVALVIFAPLGEELLFRGLELRGLVRLMPFAIAAPLSGIVFTAAHLDAYVVWPRAVALILVGWVLAWIYRWRGLVGSLMAHGTVNAVAAVALIAQS